jgi:hypothetical protein
VKRWLLLGLAVMAVGGSASAEPSDPGLFSRYVEFNKRYFSGKLPTHDVSVFWDDAIAKSDLAGTWVTKYEGEPEKITISIAKRFQDCDSCVGVALLHEMVHIKLRNRKIDMHGKEFQKEMLRLAKKGALAPYW